MGNLGKAYAGTDKAKVVRLQTHKCQLELIQMKENETINNFTTRITRLVNKVKAFGEMITKQYVVAKLLRYLMRRFDNIVGAIEESKDLVMMRKEELQISLEEHEKIMDERNVDKAKAKIALQAHFNERDKKAKGNGL